MALSPTTPPDRAQQLSDKQAPQNEMFIREVDDAVRQDRLRGAMARYGVAVLAILIIALVGLAAWLWWSNRQAEQAAARAETYTLALDNVERGQLDAAEKALIPLAKQGPAGPRALAAMMAASLALEKGRSAEAAKGFAAIAADGDAPAPLRDLALIRATAVDFDSLPAETVVSRMKPLAVPGNPWFGSAGELLGLAYLKQGQDDLAGALFATISKDRNVPATLRSRTQQLAGVLGVDAIEDPEAIVAAGAAKGR